MKVLLDTHVVLWWYENPKQLGGQARQVIEDENNDIFISAVVFWEFSIKSSLGKLTLPNELMDQALVDFSELPVTAKHAKEVIKLPLIHSDPFDRLLLSQARIENLILATRDEMILQYSDVKFLKA